MSDDVIISNLEARVISMTVANREEQIALLQRKLDTVIQVLQEDTRPAAERIAWLKDYLAQ